MSKQPVKIKRYYILRGVGYLYKVLAVLSVLIALGGIGFLFINFVGLPNEERLAPGRYSILWQQIIGSLLAGFLFCLLFGTLGQMIDVLLSTNEYMRQVVELTQYQASLVKKSTQVNQVKIPGE